VGGPSAAPWEGGNRSVMRGGSYAVVGLDLAGSPQRSTGCCVLVGTREVRTSVLHDDSEILDAVRQAHPRLVSIDAPLSLPTGRRSLEVPGPPHLRACDRELLRRHIRFFPVTLGPMRMLTARGMRLASELRALGYPVEESYPGAAQDIVGLPRKGAGVERLRRSLRARGFYGTIERRSTTHDELDAVLCAWVGRLRVEGRAEVIGDPSEGTMILPRSAAQLPPKRPPPSRRPWRPPLRARATR
jgi:uncharacterized protein